MRAIIADIKHMAVHDGPGIRTTVFFKGCPLKCLWCHNPETLSAKPQLAYYPKKCLGCMECVRICPNGAHGSIDGVHTFDRSLCTGCGKCEAGCLGDALKLYGKPMTVPELLPILLRDRAFYENSGGGVTLSGGECLLQADFCAELLRQLKENGIHTAVDTCGFVPRTALEKVLPYTDIFLYDLKAFDPQVHKTCTGQENSHILENLLFLDARGAKTEIRIPYVPGFNHTQIDALADFLKPIRHVTGVRVLAYHNYAGSKYAALEMENTLPQDLPTPELIQSLQKKFDPMR